MEGCGSGLFPKIIMSTVDEIKISALEGYCKKLVCVGVCSGIIKSCNCVNQTESERRRVRESGVNGQDVNEVN